MLGKLIKYDFRSCWKKFWPIWLGVLLLAAVNGLSIRYCESARNYTFFPNALPKLVLAGFCIAALVIAITYVYSEFAHGLLGDPGYLMFTLPAREEELIGSKAIIALILEVISFVVAIVSGFILLFAVSPDSFTLFFRELGYSLAAINNIGIILLMLLEMIMLAAATATTFNFHIYTASAIGHLASKKRSVVSVLVFIALCILSVFLLINVAAPVIRYICEKNAAAGNTWQGDLWSAISIMGIGILGEATYSGLMFFITSYILKNKLNLE